MNTPFPLRPRGVGEVNALAGEITVGPVREHLEQVLWARSEEMIEKK